MLSVLIGREIVEQNALFLRIAEHSRNTKRYENSLKLKKREKTVKKEE